MAASMHPAVERLLGQRQWAQRTPEWYEVRRSLLTASDVASALGVKPYASYRGDIREDTLIKKLENKPFGNMFTAHGQKYEDEARDMMAGVLGERVLDFGLLLHPSLPWLAASPDGVTHTGHLIEIKCPLKRKIVPGEVPHHYLPQVQVQLEVCDLPSAYFVQYRPAHMNPDGKPVLDIAVVPRDRAWFERHVGELHAFWQEYTDRSKTYVPQPDPPPPPCLIDSALYADLERAPSQP